MALQSNASAACLIFSHGHARKSKTFNGHGDVLSTIPPLFTKEKEAKRKGSATMTISLRSTIKGSYKQSDAT